MEHRTDLEQILLNGLPDQERRHVVHVIRELTVEKLRRKQSEAFRDNEIIDLDDLDLDGRD